ncbi:hypothetical protein ACCC97_09755, partial [Variovorax sp. Varisp85]
PPPPPPPPPRAPPPPPPANPLFKQLAQASGTTPKWNFYKYLIGRDGKVVQAWSSMTAPDENGFVNVIEKQLGPN